MAGNLVLVTLDSRAITCKANAAVTAGAFVKTVASNDVITASASAGTLADYTTGDIPVEESDASGDENLTIGIAAYDAAANAYVTVYTSGIFAVRSGGAITTGALIQKADSTDPYEVAALATINNNSEEQEKIGRALTGASAGDKYIIANINCS